MTRRSAEAVSVVAANDDQALEWDAFVASRGDAAGYHLWNWKAIFEHGLGHRTHYLLARAGQSVVGVLPLVEVRSWLFGRALSSLPYVNYGGVLAVGSEASEALIASATAIARQRRLDYLVLRHRTRQQPQMPARTHKVTMLLQLQDSVDGMWDALDRKVRNQVRKAEKSGLTIATGGAELLDQFYFVFARNMRDLGTPVYGRRLFREILRGQADTARLHVVHLNAEPIACALSYSYGRTVEVPSASSLREHRALCPNHLMYWSIIRSAILDGRSCLDFGRSTPGDGTYLFKEQWGATSEPLFWEYQLLGQSKLPADDRQSGQYQRRIEAWKRLPLPLTTMLGPQIARCVP